MSMFLTGYYWRIIALGYTGASMHITSIHTTVAITHTPQSQVDCSTPDGSQGGGWWQSAFGRLRKAAEAGCGKQTAERDLLPKDVLQREKRLIRQSAFGSRRIPLPWLPCAHLPTYPNRIKCIWQDFVNSRYRRSLLLL